MIATQKNFIGILSSGLYSHHIYPITEVTTTVMLLSKILFILSKIDFNHTHLTRSISASKPFLKFPIYLNFFARSILIYQFAEQSQQIDFATQ